MPNTRVVPLPPSKSSAFRSWVTIHNSISIEAPPITVITTVLDTETWPEWNLFNPTATIYHSEKPKSDSATLKSLFSRPGFLAPGTKFSESHSNDKSSSSRARSVENLEIEIIEEIGQTGYRIVWRLLGWSNWLMRSRRIHEFTESGRGTSYNCWTELGGLLSWLLMWTSAAGKLKESFDQTFDSLKQYIERRASPESITGAKR